MVETYYEEVGDQRFYVGEWEGEKGPIIGLHGLTSNYTHFYAMADELTPEYKLISFDLRGRGNSSPADSDSSVMKHAFDTIDLIEKKNFESPILMGHSMGGFVALAVAANTEKLRSIVLLDSGWEIGSFDIEKVRSSVDRLDYNFPTKEEYMRALKERYSTFGLGWNKYTKASAEHEISQSPDGTYSVKGEKDKILRDMEKRDFGLEDFYNESNCSVMLIYASGDLGDKPLVSRDCYNLIRETIPDLEYIETDANHYTIVLERQPEIALKIKEFLYGL